uniref:Uncharacterized protein n=1 Tax=Arion vulgaris TaxID=1028688 RepID=A0A0B6Y6M5_9EUPU
MHYIAVCTELALCHVRRYSEPVYLLWYLCRIEGLRWYDRVTDGELMETRRHFSEPSG